MRLDPIRTLVAAAAAVVAMAGGSAHASLTSFQTYTGNYGLSTDGWGSTTQAGTISANVPLGATVVNAYLYTSTFNNVGLAGVGGTLAGGALAYNSIGLNAAACCALTAARADVTGIIKPLVDGGPGGLYNFRITETSASQDGSALVVVYQLASLATSTVGILDGFATVTGDTAKINFTQPLDPSAAGFFAEMRLGIGFSCCDPNSPTQRSTVKVNGQLLTENAGLNDDSTDAGATNGNLITVGGDDDPFSPANPSYAADHERYNLVPFVNLGNTSISVSTFNQSRDDNIFLAVFHVTGEANICTANCPVPEPMSLALVGLALAGLGVQRRISKKH